MSKLEVMRRILLMALLVSLLALPGCASLGGKGTGPKRPGKPGAGPAAPPAGTIQGTVQVPSSVPGGTGDVVVFVAPIPPAISGRLTREGPPASVAHQGRRFVPRVLAVDVGRAVVFENRDTIYHNVFSVSPTKRFDVGKLAPGETRRVTFDRPGVLGLYCDVHPEEAGFVMVLPSPAWARPDGAGRFVLPRLPAGEYTVTTWHPTLGERSRKVALPKKGGATIDLRF